jgi:hypothetical protein
MEEERFQGQRYRKFPKQRFITEKLEGFADDIRPPAKSGFGDFRGVLNAPIKELAAFPGMDVHSSLLLKAARYFP